MGTDYEKVGRVSAASVLKHTKKDWKQWVLILDKAGARSWSHAEIVAYLKTKYKLTPWWQQGVALGFEIAVGSRKEGQDFRGKYMTTVTKSLPWPVSTIWKFLISPAGQEIWLQPYGSIVFKPKTAFETRDGFVGELRTVTAARRLRLHWRDPEEAKATVLEVLLVARPQKKSMLVFNHTGLPDPKSKSFFHGRWRKAVDAVAAELSRG